MILKPIGSSVWVVWQALQLTAEFSRFSEHRDTLTAEVTVRCEAAGEIGWTRLNLLASRTRQEFARQLADTFPGADWGPLIDAACKAVVRHLRAGEPSEVLTPEQATGTRWLVPGLVPSGVVTVLYGDGGAGKSRLALALALSGILGHALSARWAVAPIPKAMYLDWEADRQTHADRLWALTRTLEEPAPGALLYRRLYRPIADHADQIQAEVAREGVGLVVVDSLAPACGTEANSGDGGASSAVRAMMAFRSFSPATVVAVAHVSKQSAENGSGSRVFGSVFLSNLPRSTIEVRRQESTGDDGELILSLYHRKCNDGPLASASALAFCFDRDGSVSIRGERADQSRAGIPEQVLSALSGQKLTVAAIADEVGASKDTVRSTLSRLEKRGKVIRLTEAGSGRSKESQWGLIDTKRGNEARQSEADDIPF